MSVEKFNKAFEAAAIEAIHDLPLVLAQWEQGNNPEHAKVLRALEAVLAADPDMDETIKSALEARAEGMRPKLNWDKPTIARMVSTVLQAPSSVSSPESADLAKKVQTSILKSSSSVPGGSGRGRKAGSETVKVEGAAEHITVAIHLDDTSLTYKSNSASSPTNIANRVRKSLEALGQNYSTKALQPVIEKVIMGEPTVSLSAPDGTLIATITRAE